MASLKKPKFKIEPFKYPVKMDPNFAEKTWAVLESAIHEIFNQNQSGLSFEELYRNAYNMVINKCGDRLYSGLVSKTTSHLASIAARIEAAQGDTFLSELRTCWVVHIKSMHMIRDILMYMDRVYVKHQNRAPVHQLGLDLWRDLVLRLPRIRRRLLDTLLAHITRERRGEAIDRSLMRSTTQMLADLGLSVYVEDFEKPFLTATSEFYMAEAQELIIACDCPQYLAKAEKRLAEEAQRVALYLDPTTEAKVVHVAETALIQQQMRPLMEMEHSGLVPLIEADRLEDLARLYLLFRRVEGGAELVRGVMGSHLRETGRQLVTDPQRIKDPVDFVERLLAEKDKYDRIVKEACSSDKSFQIAVNSAFEAFLNLGARAPEYLSLFMDDRLRKGLKGASEDDVDATLDRAMVLFRFLQEKDLFEKYYKQHLAKRLLSGRTVSDDAERSVLVKLKTECGYQFTSKLESMFTDIKTSRDTMLQYRAQTSGQDADIDLSVQVLTTGSWPTHPALMCTLPREVEARCAEFKAFYLRTHSGRKLSWQTNMGNADLRADFGGRKHELNVSTYQMAILVLFNNADSLSYLELQAATNIPAADLKRSLQSLACAKGRNVLRKEPMSKDVEETDAFSFNEAFTSKFFKVKIGTISAQKESEPEKQETRIKIEEDRKPQIEAAIVRIMKARRTLDYNTLVAEVTRQLAQRFIPGLPLIKKRIESLIDREFLVRGEGGREGGDRSQQVLRYLA